MSPRRLSRWLQIAGMASIALASAICMCWICFAYKERPAYYISFWWNFLPGMSIFLGGLLTIIWCWIWFLDLSPLPEPPIPFVPDAAAPAYEFYARAAVPRSSQEDKEDKEDKEDEEPAPVKQRDRVLIL
jgi:hypothetical protein